MQNTLSINNFDLYYETHGKGCTLLQMAYQQPEKIKSMMIVSAAP
jgi:hypothetical protein